MEVVPTELYKNPRYPELLVVFDTPSETDVVWPADRFGWNTDNMGTLVVRVLRNEVGALIVPMFAPIAVSVVIVPDEKFRELPARVPMLPAELVSDAAERLAIVPCAKFMTVPLSVPMLPTA